MGKHWQSILLPPPPSFFAFFTSYWNIHSLEFVLDNTSYPLIPFGYTNFFSWKCPFNSLRNVTHESALKIECTFREAIQRLVSCHTPSPPPSPAPPTPIPTQLPISWNTILWKTKISYIKRIWWSWTLDPNKILLHNLISCKYQV
jgi:hypothetical protein